MSDKKSTEAYNKLMEKLYEVMENTQHNVGEAMEIAKEKVSEAGGYLQHLSQEELDKLGHVIMRDIEHAATEPKPVQDNESLSEWLKFDLELLEDFAWEQFLGIADKTRIELAKIAQRANQYHPYHSGDVTGPGTFTCDACGKHIAFKSTSIIPDCPKCGKKNFTRC